jgi:hypothetical protein
LFHPGNFLSHDGPRVVFIETTNRCHLLYQTCLHTYFQQLSLELGIDFRASGACDPLNSLAIARPADYAPW